MKAALLLSLLSSATSAGLNEAFTAWSVAHAKQYSTPAARAVGQAAFAESLAAIEEASRMNPHAAFELNADADMPAREFRRRATGYVGGSVLSSARSPVTVAVPPKSLGAIDWRAKGAVDATIYKQGDCGCCWAISVAQTVGSQWYLHGHNASTVPSLSFQELICCDCGGVDAGCHGGDPHSAYEAIIARGGLESAAAYPFTDSGPDAQSCNLEGKCAKCAFDATKVAASIVGYRNVTSADRASGAGGNETELALALLAKGPLSICIDSDPWRFYSSGILSYGARSLNHCVQLVGFDATHSPPYWIAKKYVRYRAPATAARFVRRAQLTSAPPLPANFPPSSHGSSWGAAWGESGYIRMQMGSDVCGVADVATLPLIG